MDKNRGTWLKDERIYSRRNWVYRQSLEDIACQAENEREQRLGILGTLPDFAMEVIVVARQSRKLNLNIITGGNMKEKRKKNVRLKRKVYTQ